MKRVRPDVVVVTLINLSS